MTTDRSVFPVEEFEWLEPVPGTALLRLSAHAPALAERQPRLVVATDGTARRFPPLPAPPDSQGVARLAFSVPVAELQGAPQFSLELAGEEPVSLPPPRPRAASARTRDQPAAPAAPEIARAADGEERDGLGQLRDELGQLREQLRSQTADRRTLRERIQQLQTRLIEAHAHRREAELQLIQTQAELESTAERLEQQLASARDQHQLRQLAAGLTAEAEEAQIRADTLAEVVRSETAARERAEDQLHQVRQDEQRHTLVAVAEASARAEARAELLAAISAGEPLSRPAWRE